MYRRFMTKDFQLAANDNLTRDQEHSLSKYLQDLLQSSDDCFTLPHLFLVPTPCEKDLNYVLPAGFFNADNEFNFGCETFSFNL